MEHVICNKEADIATIKSDVSHIKGTMDRLDHAILGNGQPGLMTRAAKLEQIAAVLIWVSATMGGALIVLIVGAWWKGVIKL
jgi:hypothetical protein